MPAIRGAGLGTCLLVLDASVCFSVNALLPLVASEFGLDERYAAALMSAPFYAGRVFAFLLAPALISAASALFVVGSCASILALSMAWFASSRTLVGCGLARFACGLCSGPALLSILAAFARRAPYQATPLLQLIVIGAQLGALVAQAPLMELARAIGWRHAALCAYVPPALLIALLAAVAGVRETSDSQTRLLCSSHRQRMARADSATSSCSRSVPDAPAQPGAKCGCCVGIAEWCALCRERHFILLALAAGCLQAAVDQLGGPLGVLGLQPGLSTGLVLLGTSLVFGAAAVAQCAATYFSSEARSVHTGALLAALHCGCLCVAALSIPLVQALLPALPSAVATMAALALGGSAAAGLLPLLQILLESSTSQQRAPALGLIGALSSSLSCALSLAYPLLLPGARPPEAQGAGPPAAAALLLALGLGAAACALALRRWMSSAEMMEHLLMLSLESGDEARAVEPMSQRDLYRKLSSAVAKAARSEAENAAGARAAEQGLLAPRESACDVCQKGSVETMSGDSYARGSTPNSPPRPYAVDKLLRAQLNLGTGPRRNLPDGRSR